MGRRNKRKIQLKKSVIRDKKNKPFRAQKLQEVHNEFIEQRLAQRKEKVVEPKRKLISVHKGLEGTPSKDYCDKLKKNPTEAEKLVKTYLYKLFGKRFVVEQYPLKNDYSFFIIDFYVPKLKLCIEVDGGYHEDPIQQWRDNSKRPVVT